MINRRKALVTIAAAAASATAAKAAPGFPDQDLKTLAVLVDIIIPRTETPGAADVGAHLDIARLANQDSGLRWTIQDGLAGLRKENFLELPPGWQTDLFVNSPLFHTIKDLTIDAYYSTKEGLVDELGYHGNTYVADFTGCTHPEHQHAD